VTKIDKIYTALMAIVGDIGYFTSAQTSDFETHPAIGFGVPTIHNDPQLGADNYVNVDIPVVIVDAGLTPLVNVNLAVMYEEWREAFLTNIMTELSTAGVSVEVVDFGEYDPRVQNDEDRAEVGLEGTVGFKLKL